MPNFNLIGSGVWEPQVAENRNLKNDITSQHSDILAMCCNGISSFVIFAVLDLRVGGCRP